MASITEKIQSLAESVGAEPFRVPPERLRTLKEALDGSSIANEYLERSRGLFGPTRARFNLGYDSTLHAIAIPTFKRGEIVNIKYRFIDQEKKPKYIGEKGGETWIYNEEGIQEGIKKGGILIVEGEIDCMAAWQAGFHNVISPASGKDSYGVWLELLDKVPKVYIAYDNDKGGKESAAKLAERIGPEKCFEVMYPEGIKDANEFFLKHSAEDFKVLLKSARPFYKHKFQSLADVLHDIRNDKGEKITLKYLPGVKLKPWWSVIISGKSNVGKTSYAMNLATELLSQGIPVLILPFERGSQDVGERFLQTKYKYTESEFVSLDDQRWAEIVAECAASELYFAVPSREEAIETIRQSKRIFNTRVVVVDHLDLMVRSQNKGNYERDLAQAIQDLHNVGQELGIILLIVHHIRKVDSPGAKKGKEPTMEDLKGSSTTYQDVEAVVMLTAPQEGQMKVAVVKNKGKMLTKTFRFDPDSGALADEVSGGPILDAELAKDLEEQNGIWGTF